MHSNEARTFTRLRVTVMLLLLLATPDALAQSSAYRAGQLTGRLVLGGLVIALVWRAVQNKRGGS